MGTELMFRFLCECVKSNRLHKQGACSWTDRHGYWNVVVDIDTGVAFTVNTNDPLIGDDPLSEAREAFKSTGERLADDLEARR